MIVTAVKTKKVTAKDNDLFKLLDEFLPAVKKNNVVAITSKIVAICEGRIVPIGEVDKKQLVAQEADLYLPAQLSKYDFSFTITHNTLIPSSGIDESNGNGYYVLWPGDPQKSANTIREYLKNRFDLSKVGVVITDSTALPLHWGAHGIAISYSGFLPMNNYIGTPDIFGRELTVSQANIADSLASAAVLVMGEGKEQTPFAVIKDVPFVEFTDRNPSKKELEKFYTPMLKDDLFAPFLGAVKWQRGGRKKN